MAWRILGYTLVVLALCIGAFVLYRNSRESTVPLTFSPPQMLSALWNQYKQNTLEPGTYRTLDKARGNVTTSEGESYTMLRAVWMGDKQTFDTEWRWTQDNLSRPNDHLFSWLWGQRADGTYGVLVSQNGQNSAADADTNIALALVFGYARWQDPAYLSAAQNIVADIWNVETITIYGRAYVLADNLEKTSSSPVAILNPSYLSPAAYRIFALIDPNHPWNTAVDGAYDAIAKSSAATLGSTGSDGLPPNWVGIDRTSGAFSAAALSDTNTDFGYDALRVPWNLALDWQWFHDARDISVAKQFSLLKENWKSHGYLVTAYTHNGAPSPNYTYQTPAMYGGAIGYFLLADPGDAETMYQDKLAYLFMPDWSGWRQSLSYYDDNWAWFGIGLYNQLLPNLTSGLPRSFFAQSR